MLDPAVYGLLADMPNDPEVAFARQKIKRVAWSLMERPDLAEAVVTAIAGSDAQNHIDTRLVALLSSTLDEARMALENGKKSGRSFIDILEGHLETLKTEGGMTDSGRLNLASCWLAAGLNAPDALATQLDDFDEVVSDIDLSGASDFGPIIDKLIGEVSGGKPESVLALHTGISELIATLPIQIRSAVVHEVVARPNPVLGELGCALLLDRRGEIRLGALEGLTDRLDLGVMPPDLVSQLTVIRSWVDDDDTRSGIDTIVRKALRNGGGGALAGAAPKVHRVFSSLLDGTGAQSMGVAFQNGGKRNVAVVLLKQGFGIKDAYLIPCASASEQRRFVDMIKSDVETRDVPMSYVADAIAIGIAEGLQAGHPPAPGLVGVVQALGLTDLRPRPLTASDIAALADPDGRIGAMSAQARGRLINASADWGEEFSMIVEAWYEDSDDFTDAIKGSRTPTAMKRALWGALENRRSHWSGVIARMAYMLHAAKDPAAIQFAAVAFALEEGRALQKIPVMETIFDISFEVWLDGMTQQGLPTFEGDSAPLKKPRISVPTDKNSLNIKPERPGELGDLLKSAQLTEWWVDGYLMGVCAAPEFVAPGSWLTVFLSIISPDIRGEKKLRRIIDLVLVRYNEALNKLRTPVGFVLVPDDDFLIPVWADGFLTAWECNLEYRPDTKQGVDDKIASKVLEDAASFRVNAKEFRKVIPNWLRQRFAASV